MANTYTTYRHMERKLEQLRDFTGNSASGMFTGTHYFLSVHNYLFPPYSKKL